MIYLIGGTSRSGKTTLTLRMLRERSVSYYSTDFLMMALSEAGLGGISSGDDDLQTAEMLKPILCPMIHNVRWSGPSYTLEGVHLRPQFIREMFDKYPGAIKGCVLGYPNLSVEEKQRAVTKYPGESNEWLINKSSEFQRTFLARQIEISKLYCAEARNNNVPFFDTGSGFRDSLDAAFKILQ